MIEQNAVSGKKAVCLTVNPRDPVTVNLGSSIRTRRLERRIFVLGFKSAVAI